jgi:hypothetical protein
MKTTMAVVTMWAVCGAAFGQGMLELTAQTNKASKQIQITQSSNTRTEQEVRTESVKVNVHFFGAPKSPYEVQCFFISKNEASLAQTIYDAVSISAQKPDLNYQFVSLPLSGGSRRFTAVPLVGVYSDGSTVTGTYATSSATTGSKIEGWIVRVCVQGHAVRVESNQPSLKDLAYKISDQLDAAAAKIKPTNSLLGDGDAATKPAPGATRVRVPATSVGRDPVVVGPVKAGQVVTVQPIKVWWTGGGSKRGVYCDWKGYEGSNNEDGHPWMSLVAAVGKDSHAPTDNSLTFTAAADGMLILYANDDKAEGNVGWGEVTVTVK